MLKNVVMGIAVAGLGMVFASPADAGFMLKIEDLTGTCAVNCVVEITDDGDGEIATLADVGGFRITVTSTTSNSPATGAWAGILSTEISSVRNIGYTGTGRLQITASSTGYVDPGDAGSELLVSSDSAATLVQGNLAINSQSWAGNPPTADYDMEFGTPLQTCVDGNLFTASCVAEGPDAYTTFVRTGSEYSLTNRMIIDLSGGGWANASVVTAAAVPEPGSLLLLGTGLFGLARVARRRRQKAQQAAIAS